MNIDLMASAILEIAEDERIALAANSGADAHAAHNARHDPARVLRQVTAMREIVDKYEAAEAYFRQNASSAVTGWKAFAERDAWKQAFLAVASIWNEDGD